MTKRRGYSQGLAGAVLLAVAVAPWVAACGSDEETGGATPTPSATTTATTPPVPTTPPPASCTDAKKDGTETDVDCGGSCLKCNVGQACAVAGDCSTGNCTAKLCVAASCTDTAKNGAETDVDCGGSCTTKCATGKGCAIAADCVTGLCGTSKLCLAASCADTLKNGSETDVDCGGTCSKCGDNKSCVLAADCTSGKCNTSTGKCSAPTCTDVVKNGTETDVDCGGSCSTKCAVAKTCAVNGDCASGKCDSATKKCVAPGCADLVKNGTETDVDCGGSCTTKCATAKVCALGSDCASGVCSANLCVAPVCNDTVKNGTETDTDCGGTCATKCADTKGCAAAADCTSGLCDNATKTCTAPGCNDGVLNGNETDVDCGGSCSTKCAVAKTCAVGSDCASLSCDAGTTKCIAAACNDNIQNADETDVDCGGICAPANKCADTKGCAAAGDCTSGVCNPGTKTCSVPVCTDTIKNGDETDLDCGGSCSPTNACADAKACAIGADCVSGVCTGNLCIPPACNDTVKNGSETDTDCGGMCAPLSKCADTKACLVAGDCTSGVCDGLTHTCTSAACNDAVKNGDESDVDCGGSCGSTCALGKACGATQDCFGAVCDATLVCRTAKSCDEIKTTYAGAADGIYTIDPDGVGPILAYSVYCDMTNDGGGWTLAAKADGTKATFTYAAALWTDTSSFGTAALDATEAKLPSFNNLAFTNVRIIMNTGLVSTSAVIPRTATSLSTAFLTAFPSTLGRAAWKALVPNSSLQPNCNVEGFNSNTSDIGHSHVRIGIIGNEGGDGCGSPDSFLGIGGAGYPCGGSATVGNIAGCSPDNGNVNIASFGYVFVR
ncbi:MAG: hypothetical protein JWP87_2011 [Labilithrix sp.]|nr:hypothetical protein [Labilithrix sp.]